MKERGKLFSSIESSSMISGVSYPVSTPRPGGLMITNSTPEGLLKLT